MAIPRESPGEEGTRLRGCLDDIARLLALPTLSADGETEQIISTLLDALVPMLRLSFAFARWTDPESGSSIETARIVEPLEGSTSTREIGQAFDASLGALLSVGNVEFSIAAQPLGIEGEFGIIVAGSQKLGFPEQTDASLLSVAANQAAIALQHARTRELAAANEGLKRSELESRLIVDRIPGLVGILAPSGEVEALNQPMLDYFGKPLAEMKRWEKGDIIHADDLPRVIRAFGQSIGSGVPLEYEARLRRFDGVYRWFQVRGFPAHDAAGSIVRWYFLITDIDDRMRAEEAVRASESNLRRIIDAIPGWPGATWRTVRTSF